MARTKYCLIASLAMHILAAVVAQHTGLAPALMPVMAPVVKISNLRDALSVEIMDTGFAVKEILLRRPMVRAQDEISAAPKLTTYSSLRERMKASLREKILAIDYDKVKDKEEREFSPVVRSVTFPRSRISASTIAKSLRYKRHRIEARGAGRSSRSFFHGDFRRARDRDIAYRKIILKQKAKSFFVALISKDFARASAIAGGRYVDVKWAETLYADLVVVVSIHEPYEQSQSKTVSGIEIVSGQSRRRTLVGGKRDMLVPYEVRSTSGQLMSGKIIMRWEISAGRWFFEGGI